MTAAHGPSTVAAVLVAGGSGQRLGAAVPKAFCEVGGQTLLEHAASRFLSHTRVGTVVVVAPATHVEDARTVVDDLVVHVAATSAALDVALQKIAAIRGVAAAPLSEPSIVVVAGGVTRQASVLAGLSALGPGVEYVLVHDVARPFVTSRVIDTVLTALWDGADAAIPVVPVHDTIRRIDADGELVGVVDRSELVAVQTPQGFRRDALVAAHAAGERLQVTDDAALVEAMGGTVVSVPGADALFKITRPWDLTVAEAMSEAGEVDG